MKKLKKIAISTLFLSAGFFLTLLPAEFWFFIYRVVGPVGFWEKALLVGGGIWACGAIQVMFLILGIPAMVIVLTEYWD